MAEPIAPITAKLRLRQWRDADREPFAALNADPTKLYRLAHPNRIQNA